MERFLQQNMRSIFKPDLFSNPNITFEMSNRKTDFDISAIRRLTFYIKELAHNNIEVSDQQMKEEMLISINKFRRQNIKNYDFTLTCPICFETSNDINFLFGLTDSDHICCYDCWKDYCLNVIRNSHEEPHCFGCQNKLDFRLLYDMFEFDHDILLDYGLRIYQKRHHDLINCPECKSKFIAVHDTHNRCPFCRYDICKLCLGLNHYDLKLNCQEFDAFMKTPEYFNYFQSKEDERIISLCRHKQQQGISLLKTELLLKVESRNKRMLEKQRIEKLLMYETQNLDWINRNTKKCPRCNNAIEKNKGCNHMTCKCKFEFCWYCLEECTNPGDHFKKCKKGAKWFDDGYVD